MDLSNYTLSELRMLHAKLNELFSDYPKLGLLTPAKAKTIPKKREDVDYITVKEAASILGLDRLKIYPMLKRRGFPKAFRKSAKRTFLVREEVLAWKAKNP